jgi:hypothetical protein
VNRNDPSRLPSTEALLRQHGLAGAAEEPFPNDGWSGATMTRLHTRDGRAWVVKRDSLEADWIARATADRPILREAWFAAAGPGLPWPARNPAVGAAIESDGTCAILMPDLTGILFDWNAAVSEAELDAVLEALAALHARRWDRELRPGADAGAWTPVPERILLICEPTLRRPGPARDAVADRLLPGWEAWRRLASPEAVRLIDGIASEPWAVLEALGRLPATLLHGDLKLANAGVAADGAVELVDWQMVMVAPVAIELGWFLVSNVNALPIPPADVLDRYWAARARLGPVGQTERARQDDLAILVGLLLRGWRKGFDADAGITLASGVPAADDLAWWCRRAVEAADRAL